MQKRVTGEDHFELMQAKERQLHEYWSMEMEEKDKRLREALFREGLGVRLEEKTLQRKRIQVHAAALRTSASSQSLLFSYCILVIEASSQSLLFSYCILVIEASSQSLPRP